MNIAILGFGRQGASAYKYWSSPENSITICDKTGSLKVPGSATAQLGVKYLDGLAKFDLIIRSPSVHPSDIQKANPASPDVLEKVTTVTNEFMRICPTKNIVGVTGTKGKGTTSTLIAKMLEASGHRVHLGGNIGIPPLDLLINKIQTDDWVVLELANFQLIDLRYSPHIAVCLMVEPEHQDWHKDLDEYIKTKQRLFAHQKSDDIAIYYTLNDLSKQIASASNARQIPYMKAPGAGVTNKKVMIDNSEICSTDEIKLLGQHNWQNVCAAITAVWQIDQNVGAIRMVIKNFPGLPFRIEPRGEIKGVRYYNDSFAVAISASVAAINSVTGNKIMIIGGYERGSDLIPLITALKEKKEEIRKVILIGDSAERVASSFIQAGIDNFLIIRARTMSEIVRFATKEAKADDAVVFSPGFASFDMFKNFEDRGQKFNEAVELL